MKRTIRNKDNIIDTRDIIKRLEELDDDRAAYDSGPDGWDADNEGGEADERRALSEMVENGGSEWHHGETLIRDDYFETYARDFAEDIGAISRDTAWPATCIDWERAAEELQQDYTSYDYDGVTYWGRS